MLQLRWTGVVLFPLTVLVARPTGAFAQAGGVLRGRVVMDSIERPVGAHVVIPRRNLNTTADSLGWFSLAGEGFS